MASRGRGARQKGFQFERDLAKMLTERLSIPFKRGLGQTRNGGAEVCDVYSEEIPWLHIEAKRQKKCNIKAALKQAIEDIGEQKKFPVAITKDDHEDILVTMKLGDWMELFSAAMESLKEDGLVSESSD